MKEIILINSDKVALVDDEDYMFVALYVWRLHKGYARMSTKPHLYLHKIISKRMGFILDTDHKDRNRLNNLRENLREATNQQNQGNTTKRNGEYSSKYKGVMWHKRDKIWCAYISINNKMKYLGSFEVEEDAAKAYNTAALDNRGEFACLNEVD